MVKRTRRTKEYAVSIEILAEGFLKTPRESQQNWILNRATKELANELEYLGTKVKDFVPGSDAKHVLRDRTNARLSDQEIMEDWQIPVMQAMAEAVCTTQGDILEIGFGRGVSSEFIQNLGVKSHTIVECNDSIVERYSIWRAKHDGSDIKLLHGLWQDVLDGSLLFDGIFFHTYPLDESDFVSQVVNSSTFAEHFFDAAKAHLKPGGVFTYLTNESDSLGRGHQRALLSRFTSIQMSRVEDLNIPPDTTDAMWADSMIVVRAIK